MTRDIWCGWNCYRPELRFQIPPAVFYPVPKVTSAVVRLRFKRPVVEAAELGGPLRGHEVLGGADPLMFRMVLLSAFQQRRKMLRQSLKVLCQETSAMVPLKYQTMRPEELSPQVKSC